MEDRRIIKLLKEWDNTAFEFLMKVFNDEFTRFALNYFQVEEEVAKKILEDVVWDIEFYVKIRHLHEANLNIDKEIFELGKDYLKKFVLKRQKIKRLKINQRA